MPEPPKRDLVPAEQRFHQLQNMLTSRPDVQALYLMGSLSRADGTADAWSDIDLTVITTQPAAYQDGEIWNVDPEGLDFFTWYTPKHARVLFNDGMLLEVGVFSPEDIQPPHPLLGINQGRVIFDAGGLIPIAVES